MDVRVDTTGKRVTVRFTSGPATATLGELLAELNGNSAFSERFAAGFTDCANGNPKTRLGLVATAAARNQVAATDSAGRTQFAIEVRFGQYVRTVDHDQLLADVLLAASRRAGTTNNAAGIRAVAVGSATSPLDGQLSSIVAAGGGLSLASPTAVAGPTKLVRYEAETALVKNLPKSGYTGVGDQVVTAAGALALADDPNTTSVTETAFRPLSAAVAVGYAADSTTTTALAKIDQRRNGSSNVTLEPGSSVKARN